MQFLNAHPLILALLAMPIMIYGFVLAIAALLHIIKWITDTTINLICKSGAIIHNYWILLNKTTIYSPESIPQSHEPIFLPGAFRIVVKVAVVYFLGWGLHTVILELLS